jgi:hypothetical protein
MADKGLTLGIPAQRKDLELRRARALALAGSPGPPEPIVPKTSRVSPLDTALTIGGAGKAIVTGAGAEVIGGIAALGDLAEGAFLESVTMDEAIDNAVKTIENVRQGLTLRPGTQRGEDFLQFAGQPFQKLLEFADEGGTQVLDPTRGLDIVGGPISATIQRTIGEIGPGFLLPGARTRFGPQRTSPPGVGKPGISSVVETAERAGIDLEGVPSLQRVQAVEAAERLAAGQTTKGELLPGVQAKIQAQRQLAKDESNALYKAARQDDAAVRIESVRPFKNIARRALMDDDQFGLTQLDIDAMPVVKRRLAEVDQIANLPDGSAVKLNAMEAWRKRLNKKFDSADATQNGALNVLKNQYDAYRDALFNADMVRGSTEAIEKWKRATASRKAYFEKYKDEKVIRELGEKEATPEEIKSWIMGASAVGAKAKAGSLVRKIKGIVGENSPEFAALRQEAIFDIVEPLLRKDPDIGRFIKNYDLFVKNRSSLAKELFPDQLDGLKDLRKLAPGIDKMDPIRFPFAWDQAIVRGTFGNALARNAVFLRTLITATNMIKSVGRGAKSRKKRIIAEILGYDPFKPFLPKAAPFGAAVTESAIQQSEVDRPSDDTLSGQDNP